MKKISNLWVFVSHSNENLDDVRKIRDELERRDANPILFYLKQSMQAGQLDNLLKREIDARQFFLLCRSKAAGRSRYVQAEFNYVQGLRMKQVETLDISWKWEQQVEAVQRLLKKGTVFLSYSHNDKRRVDRYVAALLKLDMKLFSDEFIQPGEDWQPLIQDNLDNALRSGMVVQFISKEAMRSDWWQIENDSVANGLNSTEMNTYFAVLLDEIDSTSLPSYMNKRTRIYSRDAQKDQDGIVKLIETMGFSPELAE